MLGAGAPFRVLTLQGRSNLQETEDRQVGVSTVLGEGAAGHTPLGARGLSLGSTDGWESCPGDTM